ncbi:23S rRNA (adenine(2503)-C(2))-methyltransferase RlmN [Acetobacterium paludosum]|uniref:Probable dual-specificity RNA methyltransferase RlmN n=1 Tax=Acetobacterium paludosum TaxID=52693 RepID=A0A923KRU1_9FIRM|nr:23S rRNA (adenine(2503)-C(2))-methyltransferase RlmN [Acetobacterium paludosum]MBC3887632.1 23S rRNA (adenine(2503)-C(2))-methyltransferase RlmN [Acetobacterium paludosum]
MKENIFGKDLKECETLMVDRKEAKYRGDQLFQWLYEKRSEAFNEMTNFSNQLREKLSKDFQLTHGRIAQIQEDHHDGTKKFLIELFDKQYIETVLMHYQHGASLCVSTQVGCNMGCKFCASTKGGKIRDLTAGEILDQIFLVEKNDDLRISNIVIMGIGEPLENYEEVLKFIHIANDGFGIGQRKISLSTCGIVPGIKALAQENLQINLAISLHSVFQERRKEIMPIANKYKLDTLISACQEYFEKTGRRITYEYAVMDGYNDRDEDIDGLVKLLKGSQNHLNLIGLNEIEEVAYKESSRLNYFFKELEKRGINVTMRRKMGREIDAACGQLRKKRCEDKVSL